MLNLWASKWIWLCWSTAKRKQILGILHFKLMVIGDRFTNQTTNHSSIKDTLFSWSNAHASIIALSESNKNLKYLEADKQIYESLNRAPIFAFDNMISGKLFSFNCRKVSTTSLISIVVSTLSSILVYLSLHFDHGPRNMS